MIARLTSMPVLVVAALLAIAGAWSFVRFLRWQFLMRGAQLRLPIRPLLAIYLAALPGIVTPFFAGELVRVALLRRRFATPWGRAMGVILLDRLYDVVTGALLVALVGSAGARQAAALLAAAAGVVLVVVMVWLQRAAAAHAVQSQTPSLSPGLIVARGTDPLWSPRTIAWSFGASFVTCLLAWGAYLLAGGGVGAPLPLRAAADASAALSFGSLVTAWPLPVVPLVFCALAVAVGAVFLFLELRTRHVVVADAAEHFDAIAHEYNAQWSTHVWDLLLDRKLSLMQRALGDERARHGIGLDLGCGLGIQTTEMRRRGCQVIGVEPSVGLLLRRPSKELPVVAGDALSLPLPDQSVDYVYLIGVLHHLPGRVGQAQAFREIARVLKPGGLLLVHESNPHNPLFRFYMGYLFPLLKSIDEGTEWWLHPRSWSSLPQFALVDVQYFTFLPDFTPRALMGAALAVERWLERGATRAYSAHYMAVVAKRDLAGAVARA
jgi:SAM-dependent methyltransferase